MYAILTAIDYANALGSTNEDLRRYARWEYGSPEASWLLVDASRPRRSGSSEVFEAVPRPSST